MASSASFRDEFRLAYGSALWTMMVLRWCDARWKRPKETVAAEAGLKAVDRRAEALGLDAQMKQAGQDNARQIAVMRLDVYCHGGFDRPHAAAKKALNEVERLLTSRRAA